MTANETRELPEDTPGYIVERRHGRETVMGVLYESESKSKII